MIFFWHHKVRRTTLFSVGFASFLGGIFVAHYGLRMSLYALLLVPFCWLILKRRQMVSLLAAIILGTILGILRGQFFYGKITQYQPFYNHKASFYGIAAEDAYYDETKDQSLFNVEKIHSGSSDLPGRIQVSQKGSHMISRGSVVYFEGMLRRVRGTTRQGVVSARQIVVVKRRQAAIDTLRNKFLNVLRRTIPEPEASVGIGYLIGLRTMVPKHITDQLAVVGLSHIIAVSGYNLTIIIQAVRRFTSKRSAYQSLAMSLGLIGGFLLLVGGSASIHRAAAISIFSLFAWYYGREFHPIVLLLLSGVVTGGMNPLYVWGDPGWYLSFLAFTGILVFAPLFTRLIFRRKRPGTAVALLIETLSAQLTTIPYTLYLFGQFSIIAPLANLAVLPLIPFIMFTLFIIGVAGMVSLSLATVAAFIPSALITLQLWVIKTMSQISWARTEIEVSAKTMLLMFVLLIILAVILTIMINRRAENESLDLI